MEMLEEGMRCYTTSYPFNNQMMRRQGRTEEGAGCEGNVYEENFH